MQRFGSLSDPAATSLSAPPRLSIVVPAYNEAQRLPATCEKLLAYLRARCRERAETAEILIVDDGSRDATRQVATAFAQRVAADATLAASLTVRVLANPGNRGKGYSVRHGMLQARGALLLFTDADLSAPIEEIEKLEAAIADGVDGAIGSRSRRELIKAHQSLFRETAGRTFNLIVRIVLRLPYTDTQCGFKLFRAEAAAEIFPYQLIERWGFDPELLYLARHNGLRIREVPVVWSHAEGAKIHMLRDSARMFLEVVQIRWNALRGRYRRRSPLKAAANA